VARTTGFDLDPLADRASQAGNVVSTRRWGSLLTTGTTISRLATSGKGKPSVVLSVAKRRKIGTELLIYCSWLDRKLAEVMFTNLVPCFASDLSFAVDVSIMAASKMIQRLDPCAIKNTNRFGVQTRTTHWSVDPKRFRAEVIKQYDNPPAPLACDCDCLCKYLEEFETRRYQRHAYFSCPELKKTPGYARYVAYLRRERATALDSPELKEKIAAQNKGDSLMSVAQQQLNSFNAAESILIKLSTGQALPKKPKSRRIL